MPQTATTQELFARNTKHIEIREKQPKFNNHPFHTPSIPHISRLFPLETFIFPMETLLFPMETYKFPMELRIFPLEILLFPL